MSIRSYIFPTVLIETQSEFNKKIRVVEFGKTRTLSVGGIPQTGGFTKKYFLKAFKAFNIGNSRGDFYSFITKLLQKSANRKSDPVALRSVLVLGLGGGAVISLIQKLSPFANITVVEIDKVIIQIAKKYFGIKNDKRLTIIEKDALEFVKRAQKQYDLVIIDLFIGNDTPPFVWSRTFLKDISSMLSKKGALIVNFDGTKATVGEQKKMHDAMISVFPVVQKKKIARNLFFAGFLSENK